MALLDDLNGVRDALSKVISTVEAATLDPATGLPTGAAVGQHDPPGAPVVAVVPAEAADAAEDAAEAPAEVAPVAPVETPAAAPVVTAAPAEAASSEGL